MEEPEWLPPESRSDAPKNAQHLQPIFAKLTLLSSKIPAAPALRRLAAPARGAAPARRENFELLRPKERKLLTI